MLQDLLNAPVQFLVGGPVFDIYLEVKPTNIVLQTGNIVLQTGNVLSNAALHTVKSIRGHFGEISGIHTLQDTLVSWEVRRKF